jgi:hypothetical protein
MNDNEQDLLKALRGLAADGPLEASPRVEQFLVAELRRRRVRVQQARMLSWISAVAAIAAGLAMVIWMRPAHTNAAPAVARVSAPASPRPMEPVVFSAPPKSRANRRVPARPAIVALSFYELPSASEYPPVEDAMVVRVQLPMSSLRLMGLSISEESADERVQADVLVGQDGLARGVRFVQ